MKRLTAITRMVAIVPIVTIVFLITLSSCERRQLEDEIVDISSLRTDIDWLSQFGLQPTGMTFGLYEAASGRRVNMDESNHVDSHTFTANEGLYHLLIFNTTATELDMYDFRLDNYHQASVTLRQMTTRESSGWDADATYSVEAEPLGIATDTITVSADMLMGEAIYQPHPRTRAEGTQQDDGIWTFVETPRDETTLLSIRIRVLGIRSLGLVEGSLSGLAAEYLLGRKATGEGQATHLLNKAKWTAVMDSDGSGNGWISTDMRVLGLPSSETRGGELRDSTENHLTLDFLLTDGETHVRFDRNVGNLMRYVDVREVRDAETGELRRENYYVSYPTNHLYLVVSSIPLPDLPYVSAEASGFSAEVSPWGENEVIHVDM